MVVVEEEFENADVTVPVDDRFAGVGALRFFNAGLT